jgi:hypothetical protein
MKKSNPKAVKSHQVDADEILPEYDFSHSRPNEYASRYAAGSNIVKLEPDVAAMFPSAGEVNDVLRALGGIFRKHRRSASIPHRNV